MSANCSKTVCVLLTLFFTFAQFSAAKRVNCLENGRFYRDPDRPLHKIWTEEECAKYFLCLEGEIFEFRCSDGLQFDVYRQICDFKLNVDNCDVTAESTVPKPLLTSANCSEKNQLGCADGTCLPEEYFCDGSLDCLDGSDEGHCDPKNDPKTVDFCNEQACKLPDCFCSKNGTRGPDSLDIKNIPQMVILSFDGAVNFDNWELYSDVLFKGRRNPNGCEIRGTFFVSHPYNNYHQTQVLWNRGHEIAVHSVTHRGPKEWWSNNATVEDWFDEMVGQANIINKFSEVNIAKIRGMRAPFLQPGWNRQFLMMKEFGFVYDSSIMAPFMQTPFWPYTLDYRIPYDCSNENQNCPTRSYRGIWEIPLNKMEFNGVLCSTVESCTKNSTTEDVYKLLMHNFKRHYLTNKAPFSLRFQSKWFKRQENILGFKKFLEETLRQKDVYYTTNWQAIEWMKTPVTLEKLSKFKPWSCQTKSENIACDIPKICKVYSRIFRQNRIIYTCAECPENYPWIRNEFGIVD